MKGRDVEALHTASPASGLQTAFRTLVDFVELTKPRIGALVLFAAFTGAYLAGGAHAEFSRILLAAVCITSVAASSCVFNHIIERDVDRLMHRTAQRPLVAGRVEVRDAVLFASLLAILGVSVLAITFNLQSALLALATLAAYALVYTPLKRATSLNTIVGAIPGAMPPLLGCVAIAGAPGPWGWILFGILFAWQFPHFLAIAWLYREDYARAGMQMLPALPGSQGIAGRQSLLYSLVLLPLSLLPAVRGEAGLVYGGAVLVLGLGYVGASLAFARRESVRTARTLLCSSLIHLPLVFAAALIDPVV
jgi:protoheme IX farnesyltransferase